MTELERKEFHVGDSNLVFLGLASGLLARYHMRRKGGSVPLKGFPHSDSHALALVREGVEMAATVALDDVPELGISVDAESQVIKWILSKAG